MALMIVLVTPMASLEASATKKIGAPGPKCASHCDAAIYVSEAPGVPIELDEITFRTCQIFCLECELCIAAPMIHLYCSSASVGCIYLILLKKLHRTKGLRVSQSHLCSQCESTYRIITTYKYDICGRCLTFKTSWFFTSRLDAQHFRRRFQLPHEATGVDWWIQWTLPEFHSIRFICASNLLNR